MPPSRAPKRKQTFLPLTCLDFPKRQRTLITNYSTIERREVRPQNPEKNPSAAVDPAAQSAAADGQPLEDQDGQDGANNSESASSSDEEDTPETPS